MSGAAAEAGQEAIFEAEALSYSYPGSGLTVLEGIDLRIRRGEFVAIVGPSGCGKSTLLRIVAQLHEGALALNRPLAPDLVSSGRVGMMFQSAVLFPWLSVWDNLLFPVKLVGALNAPRREIEARAERLLGKVGLGDFRNHYYFQLSGGMQQRLCLARSLLLKPEILLLDEPFGALDALTRVDLNVELQTLWLDEKPTVILITHDIAEAVYLADRVLVMSARPGRIKAEIAVPIARPRAEAERFHPAFNALCEKIHDLLH